MLRKRQADAQRTLNAVDASQGDLGRDSGLLPGLRTMETALAGRTAAELAGPPPDRVQAIQRLIGLTDEWIAFEARCISANNDMAAGKTATDVRRKLMERANSLAATLAGFKATLSPPPDLGPLEGSVRALVEEASNGGGAIADTALFAKRIDTCTKQLREAEQLVIAALPDELDPIVGYIPADPSATLEQVQKLQLKHLYNIEVTSGPRFLSKGPFPYGDLLEVLAMVPADHSRTEALTTVSSDYDKLFRDGGEYSEKKKTIRINPLLEWKGPLEDLLPVSRVAEYTDPETGKKTRTNLWKVTALHEIGHAVDAAYGIMKAHQGKRGCGSWVERGPRDLFPTEHAAFVEGLRNSGIRDALFHKKLGDSMMTATFWAAVLGDKTPDDLRTEIYNTWGQIYDYNERNPLKVRRNSVKGGVTKLTAALDQIFGRDRMGDVAAAQRTLLELADSALTMITDTEPVIRKEEFWDRFDALVLDPNPVAGVIRWLTESQDAFSAKIEAERTADRTAKLERWTQATVAALPLPVDLKAYRENASPWKRDISREPIKAHEAYKADKKWWQYSGEDRASTFVSTYQWRAPGEWFAELYALTWFKQVEPPAGVAREVRPYLFGGHITPDAAV
jgi:hypothetical protein